MPPLAIAGGIMAAGSIGGAAIGASAAGHAADTQANAAIQAAQIEADQANKGLDFQKQQYATGQQELAPYLQSGYGALANLDNLLGLPVSGQGTVPGAAPASARGNVAPSNGNRLAPQFNIRIAGTQQLAGNPGLAGHPSPLLDRGAERTPLGFNAGSGNTATATPLATGKLPTHQVNMSSLVNPALGAKGSLAQGFTAPTLEQAKQEPGYQFALQQGEDAIQRSAAARGGLVTGGTAKALNDYANQFAEGNYQNVYNRAFNTFETNQTNLYNRLASLAGLGQQTGTAMVGAGNNSANSIANTLLALGQMQGQGINNAAAARGSGYVGGANAWGGALSNLGGYASMLPLMGMLNQNQNIGGNTFGNLMGS